MSIEGLVKATYQRTLNTRHVVVFRVYDIGIDVRFGQGRYRDTRIVTLATRYQLENRTHHTLAFSQRHFVREQVYKFLFLWKLLDLYSLRCLIVFKMKLSIFEFVFHSKATFERQGYFLEKRGLVPQETWCELVGGLTR